MRHRCRNERNTKTLGRHLAALAARDADQDASAGAGAGADADADEDVDAEQIEQTVGIKLNSRLQSLCTGRALDLLILRKMTLLRVNDFSFR